MQGYELFGFTRDGNATVYREWCPAAQSAQLIGDFDGWQGTPLQRDDFGVWSVRLPDGVVPASARPALTPAMSCLPLHWSPEPVWSAACFLVWSGMALVRRLRMNRISLEAWSAPFLDVQ